LLRFLISTHGQYVAAGRDNRVLSQNSVTSCSTAFRQISYDNRGEIEAKGRGGRQLKKRPSYMSHLTTVSTNEASRFLSGLFGMISLFLPWWYFTYLHATAGLFYYYHDGFGFGGLTQLYPSWGIYHAAIGVLLGLGSLFVIVNHRVTRIRIGSLLILASSLLAAGPALVEPFSILIASGGIVVLVGPFIAFVGGVMGLIASRTVSGHLPARLRPIAPKPLRVLRTRPAMPEVSPAPKEKQLPEVKMTPAESLVPLDDKVYLYIVDHGGEISWRQAARDLDVSIEELKVSVERLKQTKRIE